MRICFLTYAEGAIQQIERSDSTMYRGFYIRPPRILMERFEALYIPEPNSGCWLWVGSLNPQGYGALAREKNNVGKTCAHRIAYELFCGPIPQGLVIDHKCRVRCCVNPAHLEAVTQRENILRGCGPSVNRARRMMHCKRGHAKIGDNLYVRPNGKRMCRTCEKIRRRRATAEREL